MSSAYIEHCERYYKTFKRTAPSSIEEDINNNLLCENKYHKSKLKFKYKLSKPPTKKYIINEITLLIQELSIDNLIYTYDLYDIQTLFTHRNLFKINEKLIISCLNNCGYKLREDYTIKRI